MGGETGASTTYLGVGIKGVATENWSVIAGGTKLEVYTTPNGTVTQALALTIDQNQNLTAKQYHYNEVEVASTVVDFNLSGRQYKDVAANTTFTFSNSGAGKSVQTTLTNTSGGVITIGFTGALMPVGADMTIAAGAIKVFSFECSRSSILGAISAY